MNRLAQAGTALAVVCSLFSVLSQTAYASIEAGAFEQPAYAYYIGPGVGTLIAQVLIGLAIGGAAMAGIYRIRVKGFLVNLFSRHRHAEQSEEREEGEEVGDSH